MSSTGQYTVNNLRIMVVLTVLLTVNSDYMLHKTNYERVGEGGKLLLYICMIAAALVFTAAVVCVGRWLVTSQHRCRVRSGDHSVAQQQSSSTTHPAATTQHGTGDMRVIPT